MPRPRARASDPWCFGARSGYYTDRETGFVYCTFRYYDPRTGRWLNRDPIGYAGGLNLYRYCSGNPVMGIDPLGLSEEDPYDFTDGKIPSRLGMAYIPGVKAFAGDKMWKGGSCERKKFSQGISNIPVVGDANEAVIAITGHDYVAGSDVNQIERGLAIFGAFSRAANAFEGVFRPSLVAVTKIDPWKVKFGRKGVSWRFSTGQTIGESADALRRGAADFDAIKVIKTAGGNLVTLDNRRVLAYRGANRSIPYVIVDPFDKDIAREIRNKLDDAEGFDNVPINFSRRDW